MYVRCCWIWSLVLVVAGYLTSAFFFLQVVTAEDLLPLPPHPDNDTEQHEPYAAHDATTDTDAAAVEPQLSTFQSELARGCSICLEPFVEGDAIMHSVDTNQCRHLFHENCIVSWLVAQSTSVCPCCRQEFVGMETPRTSLSSQEQFQEALGGLGDPNADGHELVRGEANGSGGDPLANVNAAETT